MSTATGQYTLERFLQNNWFVYMRAEALEEIYRELKRHRTAIQRHKWVLRLFDPQGKEIPLKAGAQK